MKLASSLSWSSRWSATGCASTAALGANPLGSAHPHRADGHLSCGRSLSSPSARLRMCELPASPSRAASLAWSRRAVSAPACCDPAPPAAGLSSRCVRRRRWRLRERRRGAVCRRAERSGGAAGSAVAWALAAPDPYPWAGALEEAERPLPGTGGLVAGIAGGARLVGETSLGTPRGSPVPGGPGPPA